jgi:type VI secretion system (T6SS) amidase immunity protein Tai4
MHTSSHRGLAAGNSGFNKGSKVVAMIAFLVAPIVVDAKDANVRVEYSPAQHLKNFALSACIADGYKSDEVMMDSKAAAGGYLELGRLPYEAYEEAASLGKKFLTKEYRSSSGEKLTLMKCIDFFHSQELEQLAKKYNKK